MSCQVQAAPSVTKKSKHVNALDQGSGGRSAVEDSVACGVKSNGLLGTSYSDRTIEVKIMVVGALFSFGALGAHGAYAARKGKGSSRGSPDQTLGVTGV